jgi:hypothetical protein
MVHIKYKVVSIDTTRDMQIEFFVDEHTGGTFWANTHREMNRRIRDGSVTIVKRSLSPIIKLTRHKFV